MLNILRDADEFTCHAAAELIGADLHAPVVNNAHMPQFYNEEVCIRVLEHLPSANLYALAAGGNPQGPLHGHATCQFFDDVTASPRPANAVIPTATILNAYAFIMTVLPYFPQNLNRAKSHAIADYVLIGVSLAKRGQSTREYLRKYFIRILCELLICVESIQGCCTLLFQVMICINISHTL